MLAALDTHVDHWRAAATGNCAAKVGPDSPAAACVEQARHTLLGAIDDAASGTPSLLVSALAAAELIADPRACVDAPDLAAYAADAPDSASARAALHAAKDGLGSLSVRTDPTEYTAQLAGARTRAAEAIAAAEAVDNEPLLANALFVAGQLDLRDGEPKRAERRLRLARRRDRVGVRGGKRPRANR